MKRQPFQVLLSPDEKQTATDGMQLAGASSLGEFFRDAGLARARKLRRRASTPVVPVEPVKDPE